MFFKNRTAVITGAAGRIGRATSLALGKQGVKLYLADIKLDALQEFVKELAAENIDAHHADHLTRNFAEAEKLLQELEI